jgi:hypothetical protein
MNRDSLQGHALKGFAAHLVGTGSRLAPLAMGILAAVYCSPFPVELLQVLPDFWLPLHRQAASLPPPWNIRPVSMRAWRSHM